MRFADVDLDEIDSYLSDQAEQSWPLRKHLYRKAGLRLKKRILDAGCGTGGITVQIAGLTGGQVTGVEADGELVEFASRTRSGADFVQADCTSMPFEDSSFDLVACHFLLMWVDDARSAVEEMVRVLEPGGVLIACAEPDYGGLVEYPEHERFSLALIDALKARGADPTIGRKLGPLFRAAGLGTETGISAVIREGERLASEFSKREEIYRGDLELVLGSGSAGQVIDREAELVRAGKMLMVPLFWALGYKH